MDAIASAKEDVEQQTKEMDDLETMAQEQAKTLITGMPVSYTHLDVYKRQLNARQHKSQKFLIFFQAEDGIRDF